MRVLIVDDHEGIRAALQHVIGHDLGHDVVGVAADGPTALTLAAATDPDVAFIDVQMPGMSGPEVAADLRRALPEVRIVALTAAADPATVAAMISAGADSYLVKTAPGDELRDALARILRGEVVLAPAVLPGVVADLAQRLHDERDAAAAAVDLDRAKLEFLSLISDRMATPLTAISGYAKTMGASWDRLPDPLKLEFVAGIDRQAERLTARLGQALAVTRLRSHSSGAAPPFPLDLVVREVLDRHEAVAGDRVDASGVEGLIVSADRSAVWGVVEVLLHNALVHTVGPVALCSRLDGDVGVLEVRDAGPGMQPERLSDLRFTAFAVGDTSDTSEDEGLGLSLYTAQRVIELCGGELHMASDPATGTCATIRLPAAP